jgi:peroxiredoxin
MDVTLLGVRLLVATVFLAAGVAKLLDRSGSRRAVVGFGVPEAVAEPVGLLLPITEIAVAVALIPQASAWWGALAAMILLLVFITAISINLARGQRPDCHCFGQLYSEPVGRGTLIRNGLLALVAAFVLAMGRTGPGLDPLAWVADLSTAERVGVILAVLALGLLTAQSWLLFRLTRQHAELLTRLEGAASGYPPRVEIAAEIQGLPVGSIAPEFELHDVQGETVTLTDLRGARQPIMLLFTHPDCSPCMALLPEIGHWQQEYEDLVTLAVVSSGTPERNRSHSSEYGLRHVLQQQDREIEEMYAVNGTPGAVIVGPDGTITSPVRMGAEAICALLGTVPGLPSSPPIPLLDELPIQKERAGSTKLIVGDPAPDVGFIDFTGKMMRLSDFRGQDTLVLFWSSVCGFCQQMEPDLLAWEVDPPDGAPTLLVVLNGAVPGNQDVRFRSPVVIDPDGSVYEAFGAYGTPMAVLVEADGAVGSEIVAGAEAVLGLSERRVPRIEEIKA